MCIFCDIIEGTIPSRKVYEDENVLAILDISQVTKGHTLVMPKKHYQNFLEAPKDELDNSINIAQNLALKITKNLEASGCNILINTNESAGQTVPHLHIHIIPRYNQDDKLKLEFGSNEYDLDEILNTINKD